MTRECIIYSCRESIFAVNEIQKNDLWCLESRVHHACELYNTEHFAGLRLWVYEITDLPA